ncbi:SDR family NAD(P)-dependent oxidoreductase [Nannocystis pusilla]|uniref:SDR family NAD(P)-dependent oxidoreductase n=1 Tax=Nannocystis pusilla TaxID=889268 RepID=A0A9X3EPA2_9BACT|nr:SDR family NAD(P)-dependent oxidoreductase [Nannocystis pusilla]
MRLNGKIAVVTGGSSGIGLAIAKRFVEAGAHVFIVGRRQAELDEAAQHIGTNVTAVQGDVTKASDLERLLARVKEEKGKIDVLVCNAGGGGFGPLGSLTREAFHETFTVNTAAVLFSVQGALPLLRDGASIVIVGSVAGSKGLPGGTLYAGAKAAVRAFARVWTQELSERRIRTNVLSPGPVNTPAMQHAPDAFRHMVLKDVPMARMASPEEIAEVALFLASDASSYVAGVELFADGGWAQV